MVLFNPDDSMTQSVTISFAGAGLQPSAATTVRDLWLHENLGSFTGNFSATLASHEARMYLLTQ